MDEYDDIMQSHLYAVHNETINGVWLFKERNVFAFTATTSSPIERFVFKTISPFQKIICKSEYEFFNGISPL